MNPDDLGENQRRAVFAAVQLCKLRIETILPIARASFLDLEARNTGRSISDSDFEPDFWFAVFRRHLPPTPRLQLVPPPLPVAANDCEAP